MHNDINKYKIYKQYNMSFLISESEYRELKNSAIKNLYSLAIKICTLFGDKKS